MKCHHILAVFLSAAAMLPTTTQACSVVNDYRAPTNLELADQSELILRGRVVGEVEGETSWDDTLLVEPLEALKGDMPTDILEIDGARLVPIPDERGFGMLSNPYQLEGAHPLSYIGGCIRYIFPKGTIVLFFLEQREGKWRPAGGPFSRWAEDVLEEDAPWMGLSRFYSTLPADNASRRKEMLEAERDKLLAQADDPVASLMAQDVERQLAGPNEAWNTIMRKAIEGEAEVPEGAAAEVAAEAVASLIDDDGYESVGLAESMEEETPLLCFLASNEQAVDCDGVTYLRDEELVDEAD